MIRIALLAALSGCTTATIETSDGTKIYFYRAWTDAAISIDETGFTYSSDASDVAQQRTLDLLLRVLGLAAAGQGAPVVKLQASEAGL